MPDLRPILARYPCLHDDAGNRVQAPAVGLTVRPMVGGLINDTFAVGEHHVLQRLHPIFNANVNRDIAALVPRLRTAGVSVPDIARADDGEPFVTISAEDGHAHTPPGVWRMLTRLPGRTLHRLADPAQAASAARLVARFHAALLPVAHDFAFSRPGAHDTAAHMAALQTALTAHAAHRLYDGVAALADALLSCWHQLPQAPALPHRIGHGDLKVSNLLFDDAGEARAIIDLDTMAWLGLDVELGDALRSWANRSEEHEAVARLDPELLRTAAQAYVGEARPWLTDDEADAIVPGMVRITLELTARFAADALNETYFGWSPDVAATRGEHNLLRARNQLALGQQVMALRPINPG